MSSADDCLKTFSKPLPIQIVIVIFGFSMNNVSMSH